MRFSGTVEIAAPRERVWEFLMDPNQVGSCGPGVQSIEEVDEDHFNIRAKVGVGFITATFTIHAEFQERVERERAKIGIRGQAPGSAVDGYGEMLVRDADDGGTIMDWSTEVNIHGTIASVGARLIEGTANKLIGQTFTCIQTKLAAEPLPERAPVAAAAPAAAVAPLAAAAPTGAALEEIQAGAGVAEAPRAAEAPVAAPAAAAAPTGAALEEMRSGAAVPAPTPTSAAPAPAAPAPAAPARLQYLTESVGSTGVNVYLFGNPDTGEAIAIDTGHASLAWVATQLRARDWRLTLVISTHGHWDHVADNAAVLDWARQQAGANADVGMGVHPDDREDLVTPSARFAAFDVAPSFPTLDLVEGGRLRLGAVEFEVLHTPGHAPGAVSLFVRGANLLVAGDTLMAGGWGRTDLPGGSREQMVASIRRLAELGDQVQVLPGHGPATTIGRERSWIDEVLAGRLLG